MPLPRLPDISLDTWIRDQQQQFERTISSLGESLEFKDAVSDIESTVPADFPYPGGQDQWEQAQQQQREEELRRQQEEDERRRAELQAQEDQRQYEAYLNQKMLLEQEEQRAQQDALVSSQQAGIASPDQAASDFSSIQPGSPAVQDFQQFANQIEAGQPPSFLGPQPSPPGATPPSVDSPTGAAPGSAERIAQYGFTPTATYTPPQPSPPAPTPAERIAQYGFQPTAPEPELPTPPPPPEPRPYWTPTEKEQAAMGAPAGPEWLPSGVRQVIGTLSAADEAGRNAEPIGPEWLPSDIRRGAGSVVGALGPISAADDYRRARMDPRTWAFAHEGIAREILSPEEWSRYNELLGQQQPDGTMKSSLTPEERRELDGISGRIEARYQEIKNDPDELTRYANASPIYGATSAVTDIAGGVALGGGAATAASRGVRALGGGARAARAAGYAGDIAGQTILDPTTPAIQPTADLVLRAPGAAIRGARGLARRAGEALIESAEGVPTAPGTQYAGSGILNQIEMEENPVMRDIMRPRVIPPDVGGALEYFPLVIPTDPKVLEAIRKAGGTVDEQGVLVNTIRMQGPGAAGRGATRGGVFALAGRPGMESSYAKTTEDPMGVGGQQRIEEWTRFRNPLVVSHAPGDGQGFDDAMRQMNVRVPVSPEQLALQQMRVGEFERQVADAQSRARLSGGDASQQEHYRRLINHRQMELDKARNRLRDMQAPQGVRVRGTSVNDDIDAARRVGRDGSQERTEALKEVVRKYGGDPDLVDELISIRGADASESKWAIKENIVTAHARKNRHDGVIAIEEKWGEHYAYADPQIQAEVDADPRVKAIKLDYDNVNAEYDRLLDDRLKFSQSLVDPKYRFDSEEARQAWLHQSSREEYQQYIHATASVRDHPELQRFDRDMDTLADRKYQLEDELATARDEVSRDLTGGHRISELVDPREARNPTPGTYRGDNPRVAELEREIERAEQSVGLYEDERIQWTNDWIARNPNNNDFTQLNRELAQQPFYREQQELDEQIEKWYEQLSEARGAPLRGRPGYEIREDIPVPEGVRRSTIQENPRVLAIEREYQEAMAANAPFYDQFIREQADYPGSFITWAERTGNQAALDSWERLKTATHAYDQLGMNTEPRFQTDPTWLGSGVIGQARRPAFNFAQGAFFGAGMGPATDEARGVESTPEENFRRSMAMGALTALGGSRAARRTLGRGLVRLGSGVVPESGDDAAISLIRQMRAQGMNDAAETAERELANKSHMTVDEVRAQVAEPTAAGAGGGEPPPPGSRPTSQGPEELPPDEAFEQGYLPGMTPRKPRPPSAARQAENTVAEMVEEQREAYQEERRRFKIKDIMAQAAKMRRVSPERLQEILKQAEAQRGDEAAVAGTALRQEALGLGEQTRLATEDRMLAAENLNNWLRSKDIDPEDMTPAGMKAREKALKDGGEEAADLVDELQASIAAEQASVADFEAWQKGDFKRGSSAALELRARQKDLSARRAYKRLQKNRAFFATLQKTADDILAKGEQMTESDWEKLRGIQDRLAAVGESDEFLDEVTNRRLRDTEREGIARVREAKGKARTTAKKDTPEETLAQEYGRLARLRDELRDAGEHEAAQIVQRRLGKTVEDIRIEADERAMRILDAELKEPLSPEEGMKAIQKAIGDKVVNRENRAALMREEMREGPDGVVASRQQWKEANALRNAFTRRLNKVFDTEKNAAARAALSGPLSDARYMMGRALDDPDFAPARQEFEDRLANLRAMPGAGKQTGEKLANILEQRFQDELAERAFTREARRERDIANRIGRYEDDMAERAFTEQARDEVGLLQAQIRGIKLQLDEALRNRTAPGAAARVQELLQDMRDVGGVGVAAADDYRTRLLRQNVREVIDEPGSKAEREHFMRVLSAMNLSDVSTFNDVLEAMRNPTRWDRLREGSYISMLSSPWGLMTNMLSNVGQLAGAIGPQNVLEDIYSGRFNLSSSRAAAREALNATGEGGRRALEVMRTGRSRADLERLAEMGDTGAVRREYLSERGGWQGKMAQMMHAFSTRPLEAADQMLGHMAYQAELGKLAQRKADELLQSGNVRVAGMTRDEARQTVMADIWDYSDLMDQAREVRDYTLLRSRGKNPVENAMRTVAALRDPGLKPTPGRMATAVVFDFLLPFFNVPLNYGKQGFMRAGGDIGYLGYKGARQVLKGDVKVDEKDLAKASISAGALGTAGILWANGSLTGAGPSDPGDRAVWLETHQPYSVKVPGTNTWMSYQGSPLAIPYAMVAGLGEGATEAARTGEATGRTPATVAMGAAQGGLQGAVRGFGSQSFLQGLTQQFSSIFESDRGLNLGNLSQTMASLATRYGSGAGVMHGVPTMSGLSGFLANITDQMERDAGRPRQAEELPANIGARIALRIPGARQQLSERVGAFGEGVRNQRSLVEAWDNPLSAVALNPYYRGPAPSPNDPAAKSLQTLGVGRPPAPDSVTLEGGAEIPLTILEQRAFDRIYGQTYRDLLDTIEEVRQAEEKRTGVRPTFDADFYTRLRSGAREVAVGNLISTMDPDELSRRLNRAIERRISRPQA